MNIDPVLAAPTIIQFHIVCGLVAVILGMVQLALPKGTKSHRYRGYLWSAAMVFLSGGSFAIRGPDGNLSWIHGLAVISLVSVTMGLRAARTGNNSSHIQWMSGAVLGLAIAFGFTFSDARIIGQIF